MAVVDLTQTNRQKDRRTNHTHRTQMLPFLLHRHSNKIASFCEMTAHWCVQSAADVASYHLTLHTQTHTHVERQSAIHTDIVSVHVIAQCHRISKLQLSTSWPGHPGGMPAHNQRHWTLSSLFYHRQHLHCSKDQYSIGWQNFLSHWATSLEQSFQRSATAWHWLWTVHFCLRPPCTSDFLFFFLMWRV